MPDFHMNNLSLAIFKLQIKRVVYLFSNNKIIMFQNTALQCCKILVKLQTLNNKFFWNFCSSLIKNVKMFYISFCHFDLYCNRTIKYWQEVGERRGQVRERSGTWTRDSRSATVLYVGVLPTRLLTQTKMSLFDVMKLQFYSAQQPAVFYLIIN